MTLEQLVKKYDDNHAEAARFLDVDPVVFSRWINRKVYAGRSSRKLATALGVELPRRPR